MLQLIKLEIRLDYESIVVTGFTLIKCTVSTRITRLAQAQKMLNTE